MARAQCPMFTANRTCDSLNDLTGLYDMHVLLSISNYMMVCNDLLGQNIILVRGLVKFASAVA